MAVVVPILIYFISRIISFVVNVYLYKTKQSRHIDRGIATFISLGTLVLYVTLVLFALPILLILAVFINPQLILVLILLVLRAYLESAVFTMKDELKNID